MDEEETIGPRQPCPPVEELPIGHCVAAAEAHVYLTSEYPGRYKNLGLMALAHRVPLSYDRRALALTLADACAQVAESNGCGKEGEECTGGEGSPCAARYKDVKIILTTKFLDCIGLQQNTEGGIALLRVIRSHIYNRVNDSRGLRQGSPIPDCFREAVTACFGGGSSCSCTGIYSRKEKKTSSCDKCAVITGDLLTMLLDKEPLFSLPEGEIRAIFDLSFLRYEDEYRLHKRKKEGGGKD